LKIFGSPDSLPDLPDIHLSDIGEFRFLGEPFLKECLSTPESGVLMRPSRPKQTERVMEKQSDIIKEIFTNLKDYSYHQIRTILGYLATNSYGDMVTEQLGHIVLNELNKRKRVLGPAIVEKLNAVTDSIWVADSLEIKS
tara:strand:- start:3 stop:422 length:420 start_codon:yes stop_codon:yes gene_type:complete